MCKGFIIPFIHETEAPSAFLLFHIYLGRGGIFHSLLIIWNSMLVALLLVTRCFFNHFTRCQFSRYSLLFYTCHSLFFAPNLKILITFRPWTVRGGIFICYSLLFNFIFIALLLVTRCCFTRLLVACLLVTPCCFTCYSLFLLVTKVYSLSLKILIIFRPLTVHSKQGRVESRRGSCNRGNCNGGNIWIKFQCSAVIFITQLSNLINCYVILKL